MEARWFAGRVAYLQGDRKTAERYLSEALSIASMAEISASNEGDTRGGVSLLAGRGIELSAELTRWRDVAEGDGDLDRAFGDLQ